MSKLVKFFSVMLIAGISTVAVADDSYLYWMWDADWEDDPVAWSYGQVKMNDGSESSYLVRAYSNPESYRYTDVQDAGKGVGYYEEYAKIGSVTLNNSYSFILELFDESGNIVAVSEALHYSDIAGAIRTDGNFTAQASFMYMAVPEPTSGMLALLGLALVGLRRKQKIA